MFEEYKHHKPLQTIERVFDIIEALGENPQGLQLIELSEKTGLHSSTVHRLLHTLITLGYVKNRKESNGKYKLSYKLVEYGMKYFEGQSFIQVIQPFLDKLSTDFALSVLFSVPERFDSIVVAHSDPSLQKSYAKSRPFRVPMYATSSGIAILSHYEDERIRALWDLSLINPFTPYTIADLKTLMNRIVKARSRGYDNSRDELSMGISNSATAVISSNRKVIGALEYIYPSNEADNIASDQKISALFETAQIIGNKYNKSTAFII